MEYQENKTKIFEHRINKKKFGLLGSSCFISFKKVNINYRILYSIAQLNPKHPYFLLF